MTDPHARLRELAGHAPDDWLVVARETLAEGAGDRVQDMIASLARVRSQQECTSHFETPGADSPADRAAAAAAAPHGAEACWVTLRDGSVPVHLIQATGDLSALTAAVQHALRGAGERSPRVEVFGPIDDLPGYHRKALQAARLVWTGEPVTTPRIARTFDSATEREGPAFRPGHELIASESERSALLGFLAGGEVVLKVPATMRDVVTPSAGPVPCDLRSDGVWVWSDAAAYYLERHFLAPDPELAAHAADSHPGVLTHLERFQVRTALVPAQEEEPLWRAG